MARMKAVCGKCGDTFSPKRRNAGYHLCMPCGEDEAKRFKFTIAPLHKSNYLVITDRDDLVGLNNKGGLVH